MSWKSSLRLVKNKEFFFKKKAPSNLAKKKYHWWTHPLSVFDFDDDADGDSDPGVDLPAKVDEIDEVFATEGGVRTVVAVVLVSTADVPVSGVGDNSSLAVILVLALALLVDEEGTSESLGKLSVYNTFAWLLYRINKS